MLGLRSSNKALEDDVGPFFYIQIHFGSSGPALLVIYRQRYQQHASHDNNQIS